MIARIRTTIPFTIEILRCNWLARADTLEHDMKASTVIDPLGYRETTDEFIGDHTGCRTTNQAEMLDPDRLRLADDSSRKSAQMAGGCIIGLLFIPETGSCLLTSLRWT